MATPQQQQQQQSSGSGHQSTVLNLFNSRLNQLVEQIANQDAKLVRQKTLSNLVQQQTLHNNKLQKTLRSITVLVNEKDSELKLALNKVDNLNRQVSNHRRAFRNSKGVQLSTNTTTSSNNTSITSNTTVLNNSISNNNSFATAATTTAEKTTSPTSTLLSTSNSNHSLTKHDRNSSTRRVCFEPIALFLDAALEGELDVIIETSKKISNLNISQDENITALHNAVVAGHYEVARYLIEAGCDINVQDSDGWTPLHCAASSNNSHISQLLVANGASIFAETYEESCTPLGKCESKEEGYVECYQYLKSIQDNLGMIYNGKVYALYDYVAEHDDELSFKMNDELTILRRGDNDEAYWWWARYDSSSSSPQQEGYVPRNLIGLHPRAKAYARDNIK